PPAQTEEEGLLHLKCGGRLRRADGRPFPRGHYDLTEQVRVLGLDRNVNLRAAGNVDARGPVDHAVVAAAARRADHAIRSGRRAVPAIGMNVAERVADLVPNVVLVLLPSPSHAYLVRVGHIDCMQRAYLIDVLRIRLNVKLESVHVE